MAKHRCRRLPRAGDEGQRYEVRYLDCAGAERTFGWSETYPQGFVDSINLHPSMYNPRVIDRRKGSDAE